MTSTPESLRQSVINGCKNDTPSKIAERAHCVSDRDAQWVTELRIEELVKREVEKARVDFLRADLRTIEKFKDALRRTLPALLAEYTCDMHDTLAAKLKLWCPKHREHHDFKCEVCCSPEPDGSCSCTRAILEAIEKESR